MHSPDLNTLAKTSSVHQVSVNKKSKNTKAYSAAKVAPSTTTAALAKNKSPSKNFSNGHVSQPRILDKEMNNRTAKQLVKSPLDSVSNRKKKTQLSSVQ